MNKRKYDLIVLGTGPASGTFAKNVESREFRRRVRSVGATPRKFFEQGIEVVALLRISNPNVFAGGDCASTRMSRLTPIANEQARLVVEHLFEDTPGKQPDYGAVRKVVFNAPCLASVGLSEVEAKENHEDAVCIQGNIGHI